MKNLFLGTVVIIVLCACGNSGNSNLPVETHTATDTITNVTNPGVGAVADDTSAAD